MVHCDPISESHTSKSLNSSTDFHTLRQTATSIPKHRQRRRQAKKGKRWFLASILKRGILLKLFRRVQGAIAVRHLPRMANRVCRTYLQGDRESLQESCRTLLQTRIELNPEQLQQFLHTPIGESVLARLAVFFKTTSPEIATSPQANNNKATPNPYPTEPPEPPEEEANLTIESSIQHWRTILESMASSPHGLSLISFLRHVPDTLHLDNDYVLLTAQRIDQLLKENDHLTQTIRHVAEDRAAKANAVPNFSAYPDLRQPGQFEVKRQHFSLTIQSGYQSGIQNTDQNRSQGDRPSHVNNRTIDVLFYGPHPFPSGQTPVLIGSHGLASSPEGLAIFAEHLASHGYAIALPQHSGSDSAQVRRMLNGETSEIFDAMEFIHRPLDISAVLDELERRNETDYGGHLNLTKVGLMGVSFGAYTALVLAGAAPKWELLETACGLKQPTPNMSLFLQCRALNLPSAPPHLHDDRIRAIVLLDAVGSEILGRSGLRAVEIPVMMLAGTGDKTAPFVVEQFRLFQGLKPSQRWLGLMDHKPHIRDWEKLVTDLNLQLKVCPHPPKKNTMVFDHYVKALSLAFFNQYLGADIETDANPNIYLDSAYGQYLSHSPFQLSLLSGDF